MKLRLGFVGNSSSSSFVISLKDLTVDQVVGIQTHRTSKEYTDIYEDNGIDSWTITVTDTEVRGDTPMDNFDMESYLVDTLGIPRRAIKWDD